MVRRNSLQPHGEERGRSPRVSNHGRGQVRRRDSARRRSNLPAINASFGARPAFDLTLGGNRIHDAIEVFGIDQNNRPTGRGVAIKMARLMLGEADLHVGSSRARIV